MLPQPGLLQELTGTDIRDFTFVSPAEENDPERPIFNDVLTPLEGTAVLARYQTSYYAGEASLTEKQTGKGRTLHLGSAFSRETVKKLLEYTGICEPFRQVAEAPDDVQLVMRRKDGTSYLFALNYMPEERTVTLKQPAVSLYTGEECIGTAVLPPFGTNVWQIL